jgi:hypothetical protein
LKDQISLNAQLESKPLLCQNSYEEFDDTEL